MKLALATLLALAACRSPREHLVTAGLGAGVALGGAVLVKANESSCTNPNDIFCGDVRNDNTVATVALVGGLVTAFVALITYPYEPDEQPRTE